MWSSGGRSGGVVGALEALVEVQAVLGEQPEVVEPERRGVGVRDSAGVFFGLVEFGVEGEAGWREGVVVPECGEVGVQGGDALFVVGFEVEDDALVFGGVEGGFGEVGAEPGGGVHDGAVGEVVGVRGEGGGGEGNGEVFVEGEHRGKGGEVGGSGHGSTVGAFLVVFLPPSSGVFA
jgi:hypothetical protein